jgi:exopolysaccharide/PEP-CTERM locus tyrosine autokinase
MRIIERVADLLEPLMPSDRGASPAREEPDIPELDVVEQSARESDHRFDASQRRAPLGDSTSVPPLQPRVVRSSSKITRTVRIDLERLRRQHMILPDDKRTLIAEVFRRIKRQILLNLSLPKTGAHPNLVMVTSSVPEEGKSFCAVNLALSIAQEMDHTVLLVDGDMARPSLPRIFGFEAGTGLMDVLLDRQTHLSDVLCKTDIGKLMLLPAGTAHPHATELLASGAMRALLTDLSAHDPRRVVIFDSPPLMAASEASVLAGQMGQVVVVVEAGKTTEAVVKDALGRIESSNVVGLLLNKGERANLWDGYGEYGYNAT